MKHKYPYQLWISFVGLQGFIITFYLFFVRKQVIGLFNGTAAPFFTDWVYRIYPRLLVEQHRFETSFFIEKADQVLIRWLMVSSVVFTLFMLPPEHRLKIFFQQFWNVKVSRKSIKKIITVFFLGIIGYTHDWVMIIEDMKESQLYQAHFLWSWLSFPSYLSIFILHATMVLACVFLILSLYIPTHHLYILQTWLSGIVVFIFIGLQVFYYSAEKIDHTYATLNYAAIFVPFLVYDYSQSIGKRSMNAWSIQAISLSIGLVYGMAGLEKLLVGKTDWLQATTLRAYLYLHPTPAGLWVAQHTWLCQILSVGVLCIQLGFIAGVLWRKYRFYAIAGGIAFHFGTVWLMGIGDYNTPWIFVYVFLLPRLFPAQKTRVNFKKKHLFLDY